MFFICLVAGLKGFCQVLPAPGAKLNYNQVMFEYARVKGAGTYTILVEEDSSAFSSGNRSFRQTDSSTATMISNLQFGRKYHWKYAGIIPGQEPVWRGPYNFEIDEDTLLSKDIMTLVVTKNDSNANAGGLIANDCTHTIVDRNGKLVWFLTKVNWRFLMPMGGGFVAMPKTTDSTGNKPVKQSTVKFEVRPLVYDLRLNSYGTITDMEDSFPLERDLACNILWKAPNDGKVSGIDCESYNHDFKRLPNGHYMILGNELWRKLPPYHDSLALRKKYLYRHTFNGNEYGRAEFGTVIEYDKKGNVVWSWNSHEYLDSDVISPLMGDPRFNFDLRAHINAFSVDKKNEYVYVGFRDLSRIVKVSKLNGKVVDSWGAEMPGVGARQPLLIHKQHDASILDDGSIAVFNNNDYPRRDSVPSVVIFSQQPTDSGNVIWKFNCGDSIDRSIDRTGGNVERLKNGNIFVCLGNLDRMLEVTKDKKIVWGAVIRPNEKKSFSYFHRLYRAHYISSLYPCYFTFQTDKDTVNKADAKFSIRIFNKGSENDSYDVKIIAPHLVGQDFGTGEITPNRSKTFEIAPDGKLRHREKIQVVVSSQTNPDFVRKAIVYVK